MNNAEDGMLSLVEIYTQQNEVGTPKKYQDIPNRPNSNSTGK